MEPCRLAPSSLRSSQVPPARWVLVDLSQDLNLDLNLDPSQDPSLLPSLLPRLNLDLSRRDRFLTGGR